MLGLFLLLVIGGIVFLYWVGLWYLLEKAIAWTAKPLMNHMKENKKQYFVVQDVTSVDPPGLKSGTPCISHRLKEEGNFQAVEEKIGADDFPVGKPESEEIFTTKKGVLFSLDLIKLDMKSREREEAIKEMVALYTKFGRIQDGKAFYTDIINNVENKLSATAPGEHIAFPYGEVVDMKENIIVAIGVSKGGINFNSLDNKPVNLLFMSAVRRSRDVPFQGFRLRYMAKVSKFLRDESVRDYLINASLREEIFKFLKGNFE